MPGGEEWANVFHFQGADVDLVAADAIRDRLQTFYSSLTDYFVPTWTWERTAFGITGEGAAFEIDNDPVVAGELGGVPLPNDIALAISWRTARLDRRGRGRTFLGGFGAAVMAQDGGSTAAVMQGANVSAIALAAVTLADDPAVPLGVYSRPNPTTGWAGQFNPVTGGYVGNRFDTMRRRDVGVPETRFIFAV